MASHGIGTDELREELNASNKRRAESKYMDKAGEKSFIVVMEDVSENTSSKSSMRLKPL